MVNGKKIGLVGGLATDSGLKSSMGDSIIVPTNENNPQWIRGAIEELNTKHPDCDIVIFITSTDYRVRKYSQTNTQKLKY